jgi:signal transduction histidine kinase
MTDTPSTPDTSDTTHITNARTALSPVTTSVRRIRQKLRDTAQRVSRPKPTKDVVGPATTMFTTIRNRMIFWYVAVLAVILVLLGIVLYVTMQNTLLGDVNNELAQGAQVAGYTWQQDFHHPGENCATPDVYSDINSRLGLLNLPRPVYFTCFDGSANSLAQVADPNQQQELAPIITDPTLARAALASSDGTATSRVQISGEGTFQSYAQVIKLPDGTTTVIQISGSINGQLAALDTLRRLLLSFGLLTLLGATVGGIFLAQRALEPAYVAFERQQAFIADAAHELRTPLTLLRANAEVLLRGRERLDPDDVEMLEDIVAESAHMSALANNLLTLARLDAGQQTIERDVVDLGQIATDIVRQAGALADAHQVTLSVATPQTPALVFGDKTMLSQAALILLDNAIKYNKAGGSVRIEVTSDGKHISLIVQDTGIGISAEHLQRLGERFYRPDKARSREMGGAGLGLSIAQGIAAAHDGELTLDSVANEGTTATLSLPAAQIQR